MLQPQLITTEAANGATVAVTAVGARVVVMAAGALQEEATALQNL